MMIMMMIQFIERKVYSKMFKIPKIQLKQI